MHTETPRIATAPALALIVAATALIVIDTTIMGVAIPAIGTDLEVELVAAQWTIVGYAVTFGAFILPTGSLSDRIGHRRLFTAGVSVFTVASAGCAIASDISILNVFRTVQGAGAGMIFATAVPLVVAITDDSARPRALALWAAAAGAFSAVGPLLGGALISLGDWWLIFAVNIPVGLAVLAATPRVLPPDRALRPATVTSGEVLAAAGITAGLLGIFYLLDTARQEWTAGRVTLGAVALAIVAGTLATQGRSGAPLVDLTVLRNRCFSGAAALSMLSRFVTMAPPVFLVIYLQQQLSASPFAAGVVLVPMFIAAFTGGLVARRVTGRYPVAWVVAGGFALGALGAATTAALIGPATSLPVIAAALIPAGFGFGISSTPLIAVAVSTVPAARSGMASGLANCFIPMGTAAGTALLGVVFTATDRLETAAAAVLATAAGAGSIAAVLAVGTLRPSSPHANEKRRQAS
ncbi:MFS transporter [Nocardia speluncae]|uniref:MFS transporter n=1 Tax=Nocardia speluncae TaxID=419477 RepID=A0A846XDD5_9NOCA|nr:MFS transporter [Nocardia speluncae]NKY33159.1 MFS transporter [Nocardia speluncae]